MNQNEIVLVFIKTIYESDEPEYIERVLLSTAESPSVADFIKRHSRLLRPAGLCRWK